MHDVIGIGFGPANIALAIALEELWPDARVRFIERTPGPAWQPAMLLDGADIQNNPLRDLVTPRNPRSRFTFVNYLHEEQRLFKYLNVPSRMTLRKEYARYVKWVAENVPAAVDYDQDVTHVALYRNGQGGAVEVSTASGRTYRGRALVLAAGRSPVIPAIFDGIGSEFVFHTSAYLSGISKLDRDWSGTVAVVGASQSAIEVVLDLMSRLPRARIVNVMSGFGYRLKDTSPFSEEVYFPEFVDYYYNASDASKALLRNQLRATNYSTADRDVIDSLYTRMYEDELDGRSRVTIKPNRVLTAAAAAPGYVMLGLTERITDEREYVRADRVVLATGYRDLGTDERSERVPPLLSGVAEDLCKDERSGLSITYDYSVEPPIQDGMPPVYLNGLCESSHGMGDAGSFSLLALRSKAITESLRSRLVADHATGRTTGTRHQARLSARQLDRPAA